MLHIVEYSGGILLQQKSNFQYFVCGETALLTSEDGNGHNYGAEPLVSLVYSTYSTSDTASKLANVHI